MKRTLSILALLVACLGWVVFTACNQQVIETPIRSFDRPSDVALACVQFDSATGQYRAHPLAECDPTGPKATTFSDMGLVTSPVLGPNPNTPFLLALVAQSARGEVAFVDTFQNKLIDADPRKPGFGFVPVGSLPEHVRATSDSCYGFTANVDSCDFARVEVESVLAGSLPRTLDGGSGDMSDSNADLTSHVTRYTVQNLNGGVLYARPSWMEIAPNNPNAQPDSKAQPDPSQPQPNDCSTSTSQRAWVAFPACQLVAELQFATDGSGKGVAKIVGGARW